MGFWIISLRNMKGLNSIAPGNSFWEFLRYKNLPFAAGNVVGGEERLIGATEAGDLEGELGRGGGDMEGDFFGSGVANFAGVAFDEEGLHFGSGQGGTTSFFGVCLSF